MFSQQGLMRRHNNALSYFGANLHFKQQPRGALQDLFKNILKSLQNKNPPLQNVHFKQQPREALQNLLNFFEIFAKQNPPLQNLHFKQQPREALQNLFEIILKSLQNKTHRTKIYILNSRSLKKTSIVASKNIAKTNLD